MRERARFEGELRDLQIGIHKPGRREDLWFEFDLNYGMEATAPPTSAKTNSIDDEEVLTTHTKGKDKFRVVMDGNRMEISTRKVAVTDAGKAELASVMAAVVKFVSDLESGCNAAKPQIVAKPADSWVAGRRPLGRPRFFIPSFTKLPTVPGGRPVFPLGLYYNRRKKHPYFWDQCEVYAAPQANMDIPLSAVNTLVKEIKASEGGAPGTALTGSSRNRPGSRSEALFYAQTMVNASMAHHIRRATRLPGGAVVTKRNFSPSLQGFLILLVQYLRTSEIKYGPGDYETFAKAYVPLLCKTHFRDLFHRVLSTSEQQVFLELYGYPTRRNLLYALAGRPRGAGSLDLFPDQVQDKQERWFGRRLKWDDLVQRTIDDAPLLDASGAESLFTPLAEAAKGGPPTAGPEGAPVKGVRVELRRMGFDWVPVKRWQGMTKLVFALAQKLNNTP